MTEIEKSIINQVRDGNSFKTIADNLGMEYKKVLKIRKKLESDGELTKKDFQEGKYKKRLKFLQEDEKVQRILQYRRDGMLVTEISKMPDVKISQASVSIIIQECIQFGLITKEEMQTKSNGEEAKSEIEENVRKKTEEENKRRRVREEIARLEREKEARAREKAKKEARAKTKEEGELEEARKKREKDRRNLQIMQSKIKNDVNLNISLTAEKIDRIKEYIDASYEFYDKERMPISELNFIEQAIKKMPISQEELIRFAKACTKSQDSFRAFCMLKEINKLDMKIESEERISELEQILRNAYKVERAIQMIKIGNTETGAIIQATGLSADRVNILKIKLSKKPVSFLDFETRERVVKAYIEQKSLDRFYEKRGTTDFEKADIENQALYRKISPAKRDEMQEIRQDSKARITALCAKFGLKKETTARVIGESTCDQVEEYLEKALKGELIKEDELQGIKILEDPFKEYEEKSK